MERFVDWLNQRVDEQAPWLVSLPIVAINEVPWFGWFAILVFGFIVYAYWDEGREPEETGLNQADTQTAARVLSIGWDSLPDDAYLIVVLEPLPFEVVFGRPGLSLISGWDEPITIHRITMLPEVAFLGGGSPYRNEVAPAAVSVRPAGSQIQDGVEWFLAWQAENDEWSRGPWLLKGLPTVLQPGHPLPLPSVVVTVSHADEVKRLTDDHDEAVLRLRLVVETNHGLFNLEIARDLLIVESYEETGHPPPQAVFQSASEHLHGEEQSQLQVVSTLAARHTRVHDMRLPADEFLVLQ